MTRALIHGNPETPALWRALLEALTERGEEEVVCLAPPGFGAPLPDGFEPTQAGYRAWLVAELERLGGDVDLVGHDWGAGHLYGVLAERPDLLRSWAADCAGLVHADYAWHDMAQAWQTPEVGEQAVTGMLGLPLEERTATWASLGMREDVAGEVARGQDETMGRCILALYRSARQPAMADLGRRLSETPKRPGLVVIATEDHYAGTPEMAGEVARDLGATTLTLEGLGHWWMFDAAGTVADALVTHWNAA